MEDKHEMSKQDEIAAQARGRHMSALLEGGKRAYIECTLNYADARKLSKSMHHDPASVDELDFAFFLDSIIERHDESWDQLYAEWEEFAKHEPPMSGNPYDDEAVAQRRVIHYLVRETPGLEGGGSGFHH